MPGGKTTTGARHEDEAQAPVGAGELVRLVKTKDGRPDRFSFLNVWVWPGRATEVKVDLPAALRAARVEFVNVDGGIALRPLKGDVFVNEQQIGEEVAPLSHGDLVGVRKGSADTEVFCFHRDPARAKRERHESEAAAGFQRVAPAVGEGYRFDRELIWVPGIGDLAWERIDRVQFGATAPLKIRSLGPVGGAAAGAKKAQQAIAVTKEDRRLSEQSPWPVLTGAAYDLIFLLQDTVIGKLKGVDNASANYWAAVIEFFAPIDLIQFAVSV